MKIWKALLLLLSGGTLLVAVFLTFFVDESDLQGQIFGEKSVPVKYGIKSKILQPEVKREPTKEIRARFFGDLMLDRHVAKQMGKDGLKYLFGNNSDLIWPGADIISANLEGPFAKSRVMTNKEIAFRFDPILVPELARFFTVFNLANNHSYDMGAKNVKFTKDILVNNGIGWYGDELDEGAKYTYFTTTTNGIKVALIGLHNTYRELDLVKVKKALLAAKESVSYVIANVHWGVEYRPTSTKTQQELAHWLIDNGVDAVIGHHPHVVEEIEIYKDKPIFYSLGNFVFDQYFSEPTQIGLGVTLVLSEGKTKIVELTPFVGIKSQINSLSENKKNELENWFIINSRLGGRKISNWKIIF